MAKLRQKIRLGKYVTIEQAPVKDILEAVDRRKEAVFARASPRLAATARQEVPVHTGALMSTIGSGVSRKGDLYLVSGGTAAPHAHLVEYGTVHMEANPFMRRTAARERRALGRELADELGKPLL